MNPKIFAIILTWKNYKDTKDCMESLLKSSLPLSGIVVVDNGSNDGSVERLKKHFEKMAIVHFICNPTNFGFAKGINVGIKHALRLGAGYVFLINNDAVIDAKCIEKLYSVMLDEALIGITGPRIFYYNKPNQIWQGGGYFSWLLSEPVVPEKNHLPEDHQLEKKFSVSFLTGCSLLIRREVFEKIGLFDEDYFLYAEDMDFCLRAARQGFKLMYVPEAQVWHKILSNLKNRVSPSIMYHRARSKIMFLRKNFSFLYFIYACVIHLAIYTPFRIIQAFRSNKPWPSIQAWFCGSINGLMKHLTKKPKVVIHGA